KEGAEGVDNVIDIKAVARPRVITKAGQRPIKRVAQPIEREAQDNENQAKTVAGRPPISHAGRRHGKQSEQGEMVRVDPGRRPSGKPDQGAFLQIGKQALLDSPGFTKAGLNQISVRDGLGEWPMVEHFEITS